ncbi:single-stranded-DNA-specific exonuclease RecJ [Jiella sp. MQZ9-1]|uniref:Single-stranded-DNA-specific exonuclease RecJ n=1 Tax=Jiella flava TaxID=2816857 RepID=A0A939FXZ1_9HYPH|nr:single-stranded-DNA-specific exonuclease RecJ [Jiella flava]MBO0662806.1 single-stranded-DNA-specific exonuclease RecJ [Jiella flava]MCD2471227.1 single-stranded-DNA-specific exonuclease RecJ [Jiella flava]
MAAAGKAFLGVETSVSGRRWISALDLRAEAQALAMAQKLGLSDIVARVLSARGVTADMSERFLEPKLRSEMPDPSAITDMDVAAVRLAEAVRRRETIAIFGDYDVDGAASAALLWRFLAHYGLDPIIRIPDRITEGYGPNPQAIIELAESGATLLVTVDCGTASFDTASQARRLGLDVVVLDHHQTGAAIPDVVALVNPNRQDDLSGLGHLAAAGVVFMALVATRRLLSANPAITVQPPDLMRLLDLVALATVCDVVPLKGLNRAFVVQGLSVMRRNENPGLAALCRIARLSGPVRSGHLGFLLGPRINAGGRIGDASLGSRLLCLDDATAADAIAERLDMLNAERQAMEARMLAEADAEIAAEIGQGEGPPVLVAASSNWHPGIVGLIAARLKERYRRPAFAIALDDHGKGTGSGRSVAGIDLGRMVRAAVELGIAEKGGGHMMAAGLTVRRERLGELRSHLEAAAADDFASARAADGLKIDAAVSAAGLTVSLYEMLEKAGPFGSGHDTPVLAVARHRVVDARIVGNGHVAVRLRGEDGAMIRAIAFKAAGSALGDLLRSDQSQPLHVAGSVAADHYRGGQEVSFRISDAAIAKFV